MLTLSTDTLPQTDLTYLAFRAAFRETLERIVLAQQVSVFGDWTFGYLTEVPFLIEVAPQVQLDVLLETWHRHQRADVEEATLLDESVVFSVCETAARLMRNDRAALAGFVKGGPREVDIELRPRAARSLTALHSTLCADGDFLLVTQFLDLPPRDARTLMAELGLYPRDLDPMFEALGRWHIASEFAARADGLLTPAEAEQAVTILTNACNRC
ncbi:MAG: hypothetical protein ACK5Q5_19775 [Planctomycetaceae bacterium]